MKRLAILLLLIAGCVLCEEPYIKDGKTCCLDQNGNSVCDSREPDASEQEPPEPVTTQEPDVPEPVQAPAAKPEPGEFSFINSVYIETDTYRPKNDELAFYISDQQFADVTGAMVTMKPMCQENHDVHFRLNSGDYRVLEFECEKDLILELDRGELVPGENLIEVVTRRGPYQVRDGLATVFIGNNTIEQRIYNFVMESSSSSLRLARGEHTLKNYYETDFVIDDGIYGDIEIVSESDGGNYRYYLNGELVHEGSGLNISVPAKELNGGQNTLRAVLSG